MSDIVSPEKRSKMMAGIRGKDTKPEMQIRKALHARGFRYRLHDKGVPGKPDLVFPKYNAVIFVQGCFWHAHDCHLFKWPKSRPEFWKTKIEGNVSRDNVNFQKQRALGWRVLYVWECALKGKRRIGPDELVESVCLWIKSDQKTGEISGAGDDE